ncbi:MAG TPA: hypothetical protein VMG36_01780, partial [Thermoplasmata archaeon]|nr:hypothetical protein [Thermoplasmata archaeon]
MTHSFVPRARGGVPAALLAISVVTVLLLSGSAAVVLAGTSVAEPRSSTGTGASVALASSMVPSTVAPAAGAVSLSPASAGSVVETAYLNYNYSAPGNFPSAVWLWDGGKGAVDPTTGDLWIPEWPIPYGGLPLPRYAPALVYSPTANATDAVANLTNTSAIAYDPINGDLYATDPVDNTTVVFDPTTRTVVGAPIPVGVDPMAIVFDSRSQNLYVANEVSNNVTVINGTTSTVQVAGIAAGTGPFELADDTTDGTMYVADSGADRVSSISTQTNSAGATLALSSPPSAIAYSLSANVLAVGIPGSGLLNMYDASSQAFFGTSVINNVTSIVANITGSEFVAANGTALDLFVVQATTGVVSPSLIELPDAPSRLSTDPITGTVFAWSGAGRTISAVNLTAVSPEKTSPTLGVEAETLTYDPGSDHAFVADWRSNSLVVLNGTTFATARAPIPLPGTPTSLVDDATTGTVYVSYVGGVDGLNAQTGVVTHHNTALTGNNTQLVLNVGANLLWVLNKAVGLEALSLPGLAVRVVTHIGIGTGNIRGIVLDPVDNELFVANLTNSRVEVVNASTGAVMDSGIPGVAGLVSVAYDSADGMIYALGNSVWIIDPATNAIVAGPIPIVPHLAAWSIVYDPSREFLYVTSVDKLLLPYPSNVTAIDGSSVSASQGSYVAIPTGQLSIDLQPVVLPGSTAAGSSEIWVANVLSGTISVIASAPRVTQFSGTPNPVDVGGSALLSLALSGGAGPSDISYAGLPPGCSNANSASVDCAPSSAGNYSVVATVVDSLGYSAEATLPL